MAKNKLVIRNVVIAFGMFSTLTFTTQTVFANPATNQIQQQQTQIQEDIENTDKEIANARTEIFNLNEQIIRVDNAIKDNQKMIDDTEEEMELVQEEVDHLNEEINSIQEDIQKRYEILKDRAVSLQKSGGTISYLEVIFGSENFGDFIDRVSLVSKIAKADTTLLEQHEADKNSLEKKQEEVEEKLENLKNMKTELEGMQSHILEQKEKNEQMKANLEEKIADNLDIRAELQEQERALQQQQEESVNEGSDEEEKEETEIEQFAKESSNEQSTSASIPSGNGSLSDVISAGYKYIGNSVYVFGGGRNSYDIANGRFDCSGFVHWAFSQAGISVGSSTSALSQQGQRVSVSEMKPGDLVFFDTYKTNGHVGIYVGGNKFIGSQNSTGVAVANMSYGYWNDKFNGHVRRVAN